MINYIEVAYNKKEDFFRINGSFSKDINKKATVSEDSSIIGY